MLTKKLALRVKISTQVPRITSFIGSFVILKQLRFFSCWNGRSLKIYFTDILCERENISKRCDPSRPKTFCLSLVDENTQLNELLFIEIIYFDEKQVLHIIDDRTRLSAVKSFSEICTKTIWKLCLSFGLCVHMPTLHNYSLDIG